MINYLTDSFLPFSIMVIMVVAGASWLVRMAIFFGYRYIGWRHKKKNPYEDKETMGLPKAAMRTFLALTFTAISIIVLLDNTLVTIEDKKWILLELGAIITFYFGSKSMENYVESKAKVKAIEKAENSEEALKVFKTVEEKQDNGIEKEK